MRVPTVRREEKTGPHWVEILLVPVGLAIWIGTFWGAWHFLSLAWSLASR